MPPTKGTPLTILGKHAHIHVGENNDVNYSCLSFNVLVSPIIWHTCCIFSLLIINGILLWGSLPIESDHDQINMIKIDYKWDLDKDECLQHL